MQKWTTTCTDGFKKTVEAATKEEAVKMVMADQEMMEHVKTNHPDMMSKTPEEMTAAVMGMTSEATVETPAPVAGGGSVPQA